MGIQLGRHSYIDANGFENIFDVDVVVGNFTSIARTFALRGKGGQHPIVAHPEAVSTFPFAELCGLDYWRCEGKGQITIGNDVWIGANVLLLDGIVIGDGAIIGAGAVVAKSIPPYAVAVGNPVRVIRYRYAPEKIEALLKICWWDWPDEKIAAHIEFFKHIDDFLRMFSPP